MVEPVSSDQLAAWAGEARERWNVPGIAVGLLRDTVTVTAADGVRELGHGEAVSPEDVFRIASITKPFVATLALRLAENGLLELDAPPPGTRTSATLRQLLSHQGGLASEWPSALEDIGDDDEALVRLASGEPPALPFPPGELFSYSNVGFWLVGAAIATVSGMTFERVMHAHVLQPLGLAATGFEPEQPVSGHVQVAPGGDEHRLADLDYPRVRRPSGGLWSCVGDLLRFAGHQFELRELQQPLVAAPGYEVGLAWFLTERGGRAAVEHPGSAAGYQSLLVLVPSERVAFAALTNSTRGAAAITDVLERLGLSSPVPEDFPLGTNELAALAGRYESPGVRLDFTPEDGHLRLEYSERDPFRRKWDAYPPVRLRPVGEREFELVDGERQGQRLGFLRDDVVSFGIVAQRVR